METRQCRGTFRARSGLVLLLTLMAVVSLLHIDSRHNDVLQNSATEDTSVLEVLNMETEHSATQTLPATGVTPATLHNISDLNRIMEFPTGHCDRLAELGGTWYCQSFDGNKDVCFDPWFEPPFNTCIAYSFGVGHDISFEYALVDVWGCRIYMYDYTVNNTRHDYHEHHIFKQQGVANRSYVDTLGNEFVSYRDALAVNGHLDVQIHYLKIDIEGAEKEILPDMIASGLLNNVWQLHMEIHAFWKNGTNEWLRDMQRSYAIVRQLEDSGFRRVRTTVINGAKYAELISGTPGCCNDVLWVNTKRILEHSGQDGHNMDGLETWTSQILKQLNKF